MKKILIAAGLALALTALFSAPAQADEFGMSVGRHGVSIGVDIGAPPPAPVEVIPPAPPGYVWNPGYWAWNGFRYVWVQGHWVAAAPVYAPPAYGWVGPRWNWGWREEHPEHEHHEHEHGHGPRGGWRDH